MESNHRPRLYQRRALTTEPHAQARANSIIHRKTPQTGSFLSLTAQNVAGRTFFPATPRRHDPNRELGSKVINYLPNSFVFVSRTVKLRKEVIHPQIPLGIPCYDLALIAEFTLAPIN